jgi:hypothetical protein
LKKQKEFYNTMKKKFVFHLRKITFLGVLGLAILTALSACQSQATNGSAAPYGGSTSTSVTNPTPTPGSGSSSGTTGSGSETITYRSIDMTILSVDQQKTYSDDTNSTSGYLLRVAFKEHNGYSSSAYAFYSDSFRLLESNGTQVAPDDVQNSGGVDQAVVRNNWIDFPEASKQDVNTLTLRIGTSTEHQIDVPLKSNPDLSQYQPITASPNATLKYGGVNWTVTQVTAQLSADATQATAGNRYIVIALKADNPTSSAFYPFPSDNFRLKGASVTSAPTNSTLPSSFAAGSTGATGTVTFLMPSTDTKFTLNFLAQPSSKVDAASATLQL